MKHTIAMLALPLAAIAVGLMAQTRASIFQISAPPTGVSAVLVAKPNGALVWARMAGGFTLAEAADGTASLMVVQSPAPPASTSRRIFGELLAFDKVTKQATLQHVPVEGTLRLYRNGIRQAEGVDYTRSGAVITDSPYYYSVTLVYDSQWALVADYEVAAQ